MSEPFSTREIQLLAQLETAKRIMNAQELRLRELGDDSSEAVAVIGEPVHPAIKERDAWREAALKTRLCRSDVDVSTPEKYTTSQVNATVAVLDKHNAITEMVARFLVAHRDIDRNWLDAFVECRAVDIDWKANPYGEVKPVKL